MLIFKKVSVLFLFLLLLGFAPAALAHVSVFVHRGDGSGVIGATVQLVDVTTGAFVAMAPTDQYGWVYFSGPFAEGHVYAVDPQRGTLPDFETVEFVGQPEFVHFFVQEDARGGLLGW